MKLADNVDKSLILKKQVWLEYGDGMVQKVDGMVIVTKKQSTK